MTVDEYTHIVRDFGWESTELIEGVVYDVTPEHNRHMGTVMHVFRQLDAAVPEVWLIDPRPDVGQLVRYRDPAGASYGTVDRFAVGENATGIDLATILTR